MKVFSYYLPQFHPDEMNDLFWGENFTDWVTTKNAVPLFKGHKQPLLPADLGYYDLRSVDVLDRQAKLAKRYGVDGFAFYHYIFDAETSSLDTPIKNLRNNPHIDIDYFLCWVNADWTKAWIGDDYTFLYKQSYDDLTLKKLVEDACWHFADNRYFKIDGKPLFYIHDPMRVDFNEFKRMFLKYSSLMGFPNVLFAAPDIHTFANQKSELDYLFGYPPGDFSFISMKIHILYRKILEKLKNKDFFNEYFKFASSFSYSKYVRDYSNYIFKKSTKTKYIPTILSGWDNTARYSHRGFLFDDFNSKYFREQSINAFNMCKKYNKDFFMIKAWNEWAEGNVLEPSMYYGNSILESFHDAKKIFLNNQIN